MRRFILFCLLVASSEVLIAQQSAGNGFELPERFIFRRNFTILLPNNNQVAVELADINDADRLINLDSVLQQVFTNLNSLKDSLDDPLSVKRIDHAILDDGLIKIRFFEKKPAAQQFLLLKDETALLKTEQDTLIVLGIIKNPSKAEEFKVNDAYPRYFRLTVLINRILDLPELLNGELNAKMKVFIDQHAEKWVGKARDPYYSLAADPSIVAKVKKGYSGLTHDQLELKAAVIAQNYKHYFTPAVNLEATLVITNKSREWRHAFSVAWEPTFLFAKNEDEKLNTFRNDFVQISYGRRALKNKDEESDSPLRWNISIGYLVRKRGDFYAPQTFRVGIGKMQYRKTMLEPAIYFHQFFKAVTPSIRLIQNF